VVEPGRRSLGDRYELQQLIASGGMGQVWRGFDLLLGRPVAVKVLRSEYTGDPTFLARFRAEAQHAASLSHPNIACVFDYGEVVAGDGSGETLAYLVMELVEGEPLSAVLRREAPLPIPASLSILRQTASALAEAHRSGMVHRDVKPGNILVDHEGTVKITDFGIAWSAGSVPLTRTGQVIGTAQYLSPEQAEGEHATPASDVYALGLVGYECLTGHAAFDGDNPVTIALKQVRQDPEPLPGELPDPVRGLIMRALAKDPGHRYADGTAFIAAIDDAAAGRSTAAVAVPPLPAPARAAGDPVTRVTPAAPASHIGPPVRRRRRSVALVLIPVLALLVGAVIATFVLQNLTGGNSPAPAAATNKLDTARGIVLDARDYVGRPVGEVADELSHLGLSVQRRAVPGVDGTAGAVTAVSPSGTELPLGSVVTVSYLAEQQRTTPSRAPRTQVQVRPETVSGSDDVASPSTEAAPVPLTSSAPPPSSAASSSVTPGSSSPTSGSSSTRSSGSSGSGGSSSGGGGSSSGSGGSSESGGRIGSGGGSSESGGGSGSSASGASSGGSSNLQSSSSSRFRPHRDTDE
jgi:eukaryotic-like serine/threonine-protein kinase